MKSYFKLKKINKNFNDENFSATVLNSANEPNSVNKVLLMKFGNKHLVYSYVEYVRFFTVGFFVLHQ